MVRQPAKLSVFVALTLGVALAIPLPSIAQTVSFMARQDYAAGRAPGSLAVGDFNGDGKSDLVVADFQLRRSRTAVAGTSRTRPTGLRGVLHDRVPQMRKKFRVSSLPLYRGSPLLN